MSVLVWGEKKMDSGREFSFSHDLHHFRLHSSFKKLSRLCNVPRLKDICSQTPFQFNGIDFSGSETVRFLPNGYLAYVSSVAEILEATWEVSRGTEGSGLMPSLQLMCCDL
ncbi:hypothetical protein Pint_33924 [Pistacia integerrima]|uniref:Uncharacterized protein n=1 Tax=Pistacia integerrima TaxID=434235 RepID=A0ACC0X7U1_9ROSI|nr:hypothetical protein Pint_33924 [Pistacia integerrima]